MNKIITSLIIIIISINPTFAQSGLNVNSGTAVTNTGYVTIGDESNRHIALSKIDIQAKGGPGNDYISLFLNYWGGNTLLNAASQGSVGIHTQTPSAPLHINSLRSASLSNNGVLMIGNSNHSIVIDSEDIMARVGSQVQTLTLNRYGETVRLGGNLEADLNSIGNHKDVQFNTTTGEIGYDNSSRRYKSNIQTFEDDWNKILAVRPVTYNRPKSLDHQEFGFIAEELDSLGLTSMVGYDLDGIPDDVQACEHRVPGNAPLHRSRTTHRKNRGRFRLLSYQRGKAEPHHHFGVPQMFPDQGG